MSAETNTEQPAVPKSIIAAKNDLLRLSFSSLHGRIVLTKTVHESADRAAIVQAVRSFNAFSCDNDPHEEHDFGVVDVSGERYFWKIDYYDRNYEYFQEDGYRVLTIMRADEY